jgi:DNA-binding NarL/FixJ family response regulator
MSEGGIVTVVVGCFEPLVRGGLTAALSEDRRVRLLASDVGGTEFEDVVARQAPRVVIVDKRAARVVLERLREVAPATGVLVLADDPSKAYGMFVLAVGATCLARNASTEELLKAVHIVARGGRMFMSGDGHLVERCYPSDAQLLTKREREVAVYLSEDKRYSEIAFALGIGVRTVETYAARVRRKLHVEDGRELVGMPVPRSWRRD